MLPRSRRNAHDGRPSPEIAMSSDFTHALVRPPAASFAAGLTRIDLGAPDLALALQQHRAYCATLRRCGLQLVELAPDDAHPDATFVEDTAVLVPGLAFVTRPGAPSRRGECAAVADALQPYFATIVRMHASGTLDGGDICIAGTQCFIGLSQRTDVNGAMQLAQALEPLGYACSTVDIRALDCILHLKSGIGWLGDGRLLLIDALIDHPAFAGVDCLAVPRGEEYAANCIRVNDAVLLADGFPRTAAMLRDAGYRIEPVPMSEYARMDGGPSCLSLRW
jgi:dimethylargininase